MYPVYILETFCPISQAVIAAIWIRPRNDGRSNEFIEDVVRSIRSYRNRFSDKRRLIGHLASPDAPLISLLPTERKDGYSSAIIIGVPTGVTRPYPKKICCGAQLHSRTVSMDYTLHSLSIHVLIVWGSKYPSPSAFLQ